MDCGSTDNPAHIIQAADDYRVHAFSLDQVLHRVIARDRQAELLPVEGVDQVEQNIGLEVRRFEFVDVVPEEVVGFGS